MSMTIDDESPLISYQPPKAWSQHNITTDSIASNFHGNTFSQTEQANATMTWSFDGPALNIYGSTSGRFVANIDGTDHYVSGDVSSQTASTAVLFTINDLDPGIHSITFTNLDNATMYIDYITWNPSIADKNGVLSRVIVDDAGPSFQYEGVWSTSPQDVADFLEHTGQYEDFMFRVSLLCEKPYSFLSATLRQKELHATSTSLQFAFSTNNFKVQLDDQPPQSYQGAQSTPAVQVPLFYISHLEAGNHILHIVNEENAVLTIDWINADTINNVTVSATGSTAISTPAPTSSVSTAGASNPSTRLSAGGIGGIVVGSIVAMSLIIIGLLVYLKISRKNLHRRKEKLAVLTPYIHENSPPVDPPFSFIDNNTLFDPSPVDSPKGKAMNSLFSPDSPLDRSSLAYQNAASTLHVEDGSNVLAPNKRIRHKASHPQGLNGYVHRLT
ncbi:hypothetical protein H0H92_006582 [Tricholoma furcatifolium]|nr:hypothetical protein H0H92_006582 [Tricholoma furcatifolium]